MARYSETDVKVRLDELTSKMLDIGMIESRECVTLYRGSSSYSVPNRLIINKTLVWEHRSGGFTASDAWRALTIMVNMLNIAEYT